MLETFETSDYPVEKTNFGPGRVPLYFHNRNLFSDATLMRLASQSLVSDSSPKRKSSDWGGGDSGDNRRGGKKTEEQDPRKNSGLFSDIFLNDRLPDLATSYSKDVLLCLNQHWNFVDAKNPNEGKHNQKFEFAFNDVMNLWSKFDEDVPKYCKNEAQLEEEWIKPIFKILGWEYSVQQVKKDKGRVHRPDYLLFENFDAIRKSSETKEGNQGNFALAVADAKAWDVNLDGTSMSRSNPSFQIFSYMEIFEKDWGVLTNGRYWRIYSLNSPLGHRAYYEIDLVAILSTKDYERFKYFYNFFRMDAFVDTGLLDNRSFLKFVFDDGEFYSVEVEKNLENRVREVVTYICQGFVDSRDLKESEESLQEVYDNSMYLLFKLMFVLNCESKGLLNVGNTSQNFYYPHSLRKKIISLKTEFETGIRWSAVTTSTSDHITNLFRLIAKGDERVGIHGVGSEPFDIGNRDFIQKYKISDETLNLALLRLACEYRESDLEFIDYKRLSPDHIGSLFEGLLEHSVDLKSKKVHLIKAKGKRKSTGSYYTPDYMVDFIVKETLEGLVEEKDIKNILKISVMDISMGSGHFLLGVIKFLERAILKKQEETGELINLSSIRKQILHNCIFGVDINPLATNLAKFSLWMFTAEKNDELEALDDQLKIGNSLNGDIDWNVDFGGQLKEGQVDAIVGNPPYVGEKGNRPIFAEIESGPLGKRFYQSKIDYFYFFFHKGLDLIKEGGRLSFISTNYYLNASRGDLLRKDFRDRSTILKLVNFNEKKIFKSAQGQHNIITFLRKGKTQEQCEVIEFNGKGQLTHDEFSQAINLKTESAKSLSQSDLYQGDECKINFELSSGGVTGAILTKVSNQAKRLDTYVNVEKGLHTGADKVSQKHIDKIDSSLSKGEGIFFLTKNEVEALKLSKKEMNRLVPVFKNSDIYKFRTYNKPEIWMIDFAYPRDKDLDIKAEFPKLYSHLSKYKKVLVKRKDTANGLQNAIKKDIWWTIAARKKMNFDGPKIVAPQRSMNNTFGFNNESWYGSGDIYFISTYNDRPYDLKFLTGLLNSKLMYFWLYYCGKRKGEALELYQDPISEIMLKDFSPKFIKQISDLASDIIEGNPGAVLDKKFEKLNAEIYQYYDLTKEEIRNVEEHYNSRFGLELSSLINVP